MKLSKATLLLKAVLIFCAIALALVAFGAVPAYAGLKAFLFRLIHWFLPISVPAACGKERSFLYFIRGISPGKIYSSTQM